MTDIQGMAQEKITQTAEADGKAAFQREMIFPIGEPNTAYAKYFIGNSYLVPISTEQIPFNNVTFEPGCRNNWHIHHATKGGGQWPAGAGIRKRASLPCGCFPAMSSIFRRMSSTGMGRQRTAGSRISHSKFLEKTCPTNGWNP